MALRPVEGLPAGGLALVRALEGMFAEGRVSSTKKQREIRKERCYLLVEWYSNSILRSSDFGISKFGVWAARLW